MSEPPDIDDILNGKTNRHVRWYILEGKTPVRASVTEWSKWRTDPKNSITVDETIKGKTRVHTAFLGLDHGHFYDGKEHAPVLFETMTFAIDPTATYGFRVLDYGSRCCTWDEAVEMHKRACRHAFGAPLKIVGGKDRE